MPIALCLPVCICNTQRECISIQVLGILFSLQYASWQVYRVLDFGSATTLPCSMQPTELQGASFANNLCDWSTRIVNKQQVACRS